MTMNLHTIIRARYLEAADTDDRLPSARLEPSSARGFWPAYDYTFEDMNGWGTERLAEDREFRFRRLPPSMQAIKRHAEVMDWTGSILTSPEHRHLVWGWAQCIVRGRSFSGWCRDTNRHRRTAVARTERAFDLIVSHFRRKGDLPTLPEQKWLFQLCDAECNIPTTIANCASEEWAVKRPISWIDPDHKPIDTLTNEAAVAEFERFLAKTRKRRRRQQEARAAA